MVLQSAGTSTDIILTSPEENDQASASAAGTDMGQLQAARAFFDARYNVRTNTTAQIGARSTNTNTTLGISTYRWIDPRGRFN